MDEKGLKGLDKRTSRARGSNISLELGENPVRDVFKMLPRPQKSCLYLSTPQHTFKDEIAVSRHLLTTHWSYIEDAFC